MLRTLSVLAVCASPVQATPTPSYLVGVWECAPRGGGPAFEWVVTDDLPGGWITGRGLENGELTSLETWSHDNGVLDVRRQFSPRGSYIELRVEERTDTAITSRGTANERDGMIVALEHTLTVIDVNTFGAVWLADLGDGMSTIADEVCTRQQR